MSRSKNRLYTEIRREHKLYWQRWFQMCARCRNGRQRSYRNTRVHLDWQGEQGFVNFYDHMGLPPTPKHTLDRVDPYGHYEPGNVVWATRKENMNNMKVHHRGNGVYKKLAQQNGISTHTYYRRVRRGWNKKHAATFKPMWGYSYKQRLS